VAGDGIVSHQGQPALLAVDKLHRQPARGQPVHARNVMIIGVLHLHPGRLAAIDTRHAQPHHGVILAGKRVVMVFLRAVTGLVFALVNDAVDGNVGFIHFSEGDLATVP